MDKKKILGNVFVGFAMTALVGGLLIGIFGDRNQNIDNDKNNNNVIDYYGKSISEQNNIQESKEMELKELEENPHGEDYEDLGELEAQEIDESLLPTPYKEIIGEDLTKETKRFTKEFIEIFYNFDGDDTKRFIEESKDYMTTSLYDRLISEPERPTHTEFSRKYISSEISESKSFTKADSEQIIPYILTIKGETVDVMGENKQEITDVYVIVLSIQDNDYKVDQIYKNIYFE